VVRRQLSKSQRKEKTWSSVLFFFKWLCVKKWKELSTRKHATFLSVVCVHKKYTHTKNLQLQHKYHELSRGIGNTYLCISPNFHFFQVEYLWGSVVKYQPSSAPPLSDIGNCAAPLFLQLFAKRSLNIRD
jgi:hypothetical protein